MSKLLASSAHPYPIPASVDAKFPWSSLLIHLDYLKCLINFEFDYWHKKLILLNVWVLSNIPHPMPLNLITIDSGNSLLTDGTKPSNINLSSIWSSLMYLFTLITKMSLKTVAIKLHPNLSQTTASLFSYSSVSLVINWYIDIHGRIVSALVQNLCHVQQVLIIDAAMVQGKIVVTRVH